MKPDNSFEKLCNQLNAMTVQELRVFAREQFDVVPGAKKKAQLVDAVIDAYFGKQPRPRKKTGRPTVDQLQSSLNVFFDDGKDDEEQKKMEKTPILMEKSQFSVGYPQFLSP